MPSFEQARQIVMEAASGLLRAPTSETVELLEALGRILAEPILADRDYPPFHRATRDGFAVRAADVTGAGRILDIIGEIKAGDSFSGEIRSGQCAQIMTGAAVPPGADSVVMIEHTKPSKTRVAVERAAEAGQNVVPKGSEARAGQTLLGPGTRLGYPELAIAAQVGRTKLAVAKKPRVAVLSTGDEVVLVDQTPGPFQIRNSNSISLASQVLLAGGEPVLLGNAADRVEDLRKKVETGLTSDILILSGGVSMGKYDFVEMVLRALGAQFFFDTVEIRPGKPAVFGICKGKLVFGLPGNPVSTMVTFELFVPPAIELLSGAKPRPLPVFRAKLEAPVKLKAPLTHFLPARVEWTGGEPKVRELPWKGSGDIVALGQANAYLVVRPEKLELAAGELVEVLPRRGSL
ncbi:MAG TPA: gephyrin-like molybdotransferase Glp [Candidatus Acidoferrales bacterium]|nr:gephyrin-like molybdotransferase Glp [Candidatus Acidoferrales bacterium]